MLNTVRAGLIASLTSKLVDELLEAHAEAKRNYYLGGFRLSEVEGGRFSEAAFRLLEFITTGSSTPLGKQVNSERLIKTLAEYSSEAFPDAVRIHIPRALRLVYDIRNKRDAAHLADGIDPNTQDATLVVSAIDWVLAEFIRLYHTLPASEAQAMVDSIVTRAVPAVQDFNGHLKVLKPSLGATDVCLVLLYQRGAKGATPEEVSRWVRSRMRKNLPRTLRGLVDDRAFAHDDGRRYYITQLGQRDVERRGLVTPEDS